MRRRLRTYVVAALQTVMPGVGTSALALLQAPQPVPTTAVLTTLINDLGADDGDRSGTYCAASLPRLPVYGLAEQVSVTVVAGVLLDHVHEDPSQGRPPLTVPGRMRRGECGFTGHEMCRHDAP